MKTKHTLMVVLVFLVASFSLFAGEVSKEQARLVAQNLYLEQTSGDQTGIPLPELLNCQTLEENGLTLYYTFFIDNHQGFITIAADDRIPPILAWSINGNDITDKEPPPAYTWFMNQLADQISWIIQEQITPEPETVEAWKQYTDPGFSPAEGISAVSPMVQTTWNQGCYYNEDCPYDASATNYCDHALTGCGATAMAQIIRFWEAPLHGVGSHSYYHSNYGTLSANFGAATYNYSAMPMSLSNNNAAVAQLMYHCGVAQDMDYGPAGSSSYANAIDVAFATYFDYNNSIVWRWKDNYSSSQWTSQLIAELEAGRPMIYYGNNNGQGGHFFICDGYQGSNHFHFNWGWGGSYDGYFYTNNLNPGGNIFNDSQGAIFNIYPNQAPPPPVGFTMDFESTSDFSLTFSPWTVNDLDGSNTYTITNHTFPNQGDAMAYICFNPAQVSPPMTEPAIQPHGGSRFGACFAATSPPNNDWFISPQIQLGVGGEFSFWVKSYTADYGLERYKVGVSTTNNNPGSFTFISGSNYLEAPTTWTKKTFDLSAYNNQQIYVAIQCVSHDAFIFIIDDLEVKTGSSAGLTANFSASQTNINVGDFINFVDQSSGNPTSWQWSFPGGNPSSSITQNPVNIRYNMPGVYDVTLTVGDGSTTDTKTKTGYIIVSQGGLPSYMTLDFEGLSNFTTNFSPWMTNDVNGGATYTIVDVTFPGQGEEMAYIAFNPSQTTPPLTNMSAHSGARFGASFATIPPNNPNNKWLISPQMQLGSNPGMSLWVQSYTSEYGFEKFNIGVSTGGTNPGDFVLINTGGPEQAPTTWTKKSYNLGAFANQQVYIGIQCVSDDAFIFMIDDIEISGNVGIDEGMEFSNITLFPNPARERFFINADPGLEAGVSLEIINPLGAVLSTVMLDHFQTMIEIPTTGLPQGIFFLVIKQESKAMVRKFSVVE